VEPTRPGLITFLAATRNSLSVQWDPLLGEDTGGTLANPIGITAYELYMDNGFNGDFELVTSQVGTTYTINYLTPGLLYRFRLRATNLIGYNSAFSTVQSMMCGTTPSSPGSPILVSQSSSLIHFYWTEPFDNGGTSITSY